MTKDFAKRNRKSPALSRVSWRRSLAGLAVGLMLAGCSGGPPVNDGPSATEKPSTSAAAALAPGKLTLIAHRVAWRVYPEASAESFDAVAQTGFPIEFDLHRLSDGTLVPSHDATADRSMKGISGPLESISPAQWHTASVRSQDGESFGTPTTWDAVLERYGGKTVLVPELKRPVTDVSGFIEPIIERGLQDSIVVQSRDYEACKKIAAAGVKAALVLVEGQPDPAAIRADGIEYVAVSRDHPASYFTELKDAGLEIWVFLLNRAAPLEEYLDLGVDGVFTDDPWKLESELTEIGVPVAGS